ncbi:MAG TPA: hypothetical protein VFO31_06855, partial [Vicinamibacterales bacterium]|nr:hypothetical protein [Vicinamibacterales bacterium]
MRCGRLFTFILLAVATLAPSAQAQQLTLREAIARARQASQVSAASRVRTEAARTSTGMVNRLLNPAVEFRTENWGSGTPNLPEDTFLVLTQPLELGGKSSARRAQQRSAIESAEAAAA